MIFREEGKGREKNIDWLSPARPLPRIDPATVHMPWMGMELTIFQCMGWCPTKWATPARAIEFSFNPLYFYGISCHFPFISDFIWVFFFSLMSWVKGLSILCFQRVALGFIDLLFFKTLFLLRSLLFPSSCSLWILFVLFLIPLSIRLDSSFEVFFHEVDLYCYEFP